MKLILLQNVKSLGKAGDVVNVSDGYARNMLLPKGIAVQDAKDLAKKLEGIKITVKMKAGENGKAFGSVSSKEIAEAAKAQHALELDKKKIQLDEPIRTFGMHEVPIRLHPEVTGTLYVLVQEA